MKKALFRSYEVTGAQVFDPKNQHIYSQMGQKNQTYTCALQVEIDWNEEITQKYPCDFRRVEH